MEEEKADHLYRLFQAVDAGARQKRGLGFGGVTPVHPPPAAVRNVGAVPYKLSDKFANSPEDSPERAPACQEGSTKQVTSHKRTREQSPSSHGKTGGSKRLLPNGGYDARRGSPGDVGRRASPGRWEDVGAVAGERGGREPEHKRCRREEQAGAGGQRASHSESPTRVRERRNERLRDSVSGHKRKHGKGGPNTDFYQDGPLSSPQQGTERRDKTSRYRRDSSQEREPRPPRHGGSRADRDDRESAWETRSRNRRPEDTSNGHEDGRYSSRVDSREGSGRDGRGGSSRHETERGGRREEWARSDRNGERGEDRRRRGNEGDRHREDEGDRHRSRQAHEGDRHRADEGGRHRADEGGRHRADEGDRHRPRHDGERAPRREDGGRYRQPGDQSSRPAWDRAKDTEREGRGTRNAPGKPLDFARLIPGYDSMSAVQRMKAKTKYLLNAGQAQDERRRKEAGDEVGKPWTRYVFSNDALLDEEGGRAEGGFDAGSNAVTFKVTAAKASAMTAEQAHEAAIFGAAPKVVPVSENGTRQRNTNGATPAGGLGFAGRHSRSESPSRSEGSPLSEDSQQGKGPGGVAVAPEVVAQQQTMSWRERALLMKMKKSETAS